MYYVLTGKSDVVLTVLTVRPSANSRHMAKQALNRLYVFALVDKKCREAVAEVVKSESLPTFHPEADLNRGWANFILCHHADTQGRAALHLCRRGNLVVRLRIERIKKNPTEALTVLQAAPPIEFGQIIFVANISCLYPTYVRGES